MNEGFPVVPPAIYRTYVLAMGGANGSILLPFVYTVFPDAISDQDYYQFLLPICKSRVNQTFITDAWSDKNKLWMTSPQFKQ